MSNNDSYYKKILGESFELAVKNKNLKSKEYNITKENELLKARVKELEKKLKIAEEALQYYAELYIDTDICDDQFFGYDAQQALKQMEEVK